MNLSGNLAYDVLVNDPPPQEGLLPNGEPKRFSPQATTLIYGSEDAVLPAPRGDPGRLPGRAGRRATRGPVRRLIPPAPVTAVTVPGNRFALEGHDLVIVETGDTDSADSTVLHVPDLGLVVAGDVIYNGVHMYLAQRAIVGGLGPWRAAIDTVEALQPRHIVCGHQNKELDDDAGRTIAETRQYLDDADELLSTENTATGFFNAKIERYPDHLGRMILWIGASVVYGVRDHPEEDIRKIILSSWL